MTRQAERERRREYMSALMERGYSESAARYHWHRLRQDPEHRARKNDRWYPTREMLVKNYWFDHDELRLYSKLTKKPMSTHKVYNPNGSYHRIYACCFNGKHKPVSVALVTYMFTRLCDVDPKYVIDHIDNDPDNNDPGNLQMLTIAENAHKEGYFNQYSKEGQ